MENLNYQATKKMGQPYEVKNEFLNINGYDWKFSTHKEGRKIKCYATGGNYINGNWTYVITGNTTILIYEEIARATKKNIELVNKTGLLVWADKLAKNEILKHKDYIEPVAPVPTYKKDNLDKLGEDNFWLSCEPGELKVFKIDCRFDLEYNQLTYSPLEDGFIMIASYICNEGEKILLDQAILKEDLINYFSPSICKDIQELKGSNFLDQEENFIHLSYLPTKEEKTKALPMPATKKKFIPRPPKVVQKVKVVKEESAKDEKGTFVFLDDESYFIDDVGGFGFCIQRSNDKNDAMQFKSKKVAEKYQADHLEVLEDYKIVSI